MAQTRHPPKSIPNPQRIRHQEHTISIARIQMGASVQIDVLPWYVPNNPIIQQLPVVDCFSGQTVWRLVAVVGRHVHFAYLNARERVWRVMRVLVGPACRAIRGGRGWVICR